MMKSVTTYRYCLILILLLAVLLCLNTKLSAQNGIDYSKKEISEFNKSAFDDDSISGPEGLSDIEAGLNYEIGLKQFSKDEKIKRSSVTRTSTIRGDVDGDGHVYMRDLYLIVDYILERNPETFIRENADLDGNGKIDINDVAIIMVE